MPYIPENDRRKLNPFIQNLGDKIAYLNRRSNSPYISVWGYLRCAALRIVEETALRAASVYRGSGGIRYWLIVDHAGIVMNVASELYDRVLLPIESASQVSYPFSPKSLSRRLSPVPPDVLILDPEINALIEEIYQIGGPEGYNYDAAYNGLVNYSLTELAPYVLMNVCDEINIPFDRLVVEDMVHFWFALSRELYVHVARRYEDKQIEKNGDVAAYGLMLERIANNL